ncbi:MAG: hypothetical protein U0U70_17210 [Chitinophagaceae bacterium]
MRLCYVLMVLALFCNVASSAQQNDSTSLQQLPSRYIGTVSSKAASLENKLDKKSEKALAQIKKQEDRIIRKLSRIDSAKAKELAATAKARYEQLQTKLRNPGKLASYIPGLDSMHTTLNFLNNAPAISTATEKLKDAISKVDGLKAQLQKAEDLRAFFKERKQYLKEQLEKLGFAKELKKLNKQVYYYARQLNEYKEILNDPKKIEKKALELLSKTKLWKDFFRKNSMLASLFRLPDPEAPMDMASLAGLQTRAQVNTLVQNQIAAGGPDARQVLQQNLQAAQSQLNQLKDKVLRSGGGSSDAEMPEGFKPNEQKTKSFLKRLEYGTNLQTQKANNFFPVTSDLGLSLGYKLNDRSVIGIGASYKMGWGRGWNNIHITSQGVGLRSYADWKIKGSFWISGGYEKNYQPLLNGAGGPVPVGGAGGGALSGRSWREAGWLGISKIVSIKSKLFKKTRVMLLWDFLSYRQVPRTQPVVFRIGYTF